MMLTRKRLLTSFSRHSFPIGAGVDFRRSAGGWTVILWHSFPVAFSLQVGWSRRGWYTADESGTAALQSLDNYHAGEQGAEYVDEWDRLRAEEERAGLA